MDQTPYFFLPPLEEPWRIVAMTDAAGRMRIDWFPRDAIATDWDCAFVSVTAHRDRAGPPTAEEAAAVGLLPGLADGQAAIEHAEDADNETAFICQCTGDFAVPDQTVIVRLVADGGLLAGIACRLRPPEPGDRARALIGRLRDALTCQELPAFDAFDPARDDRYRSQLEPYLRALDEAMPADDFGRALEIIEALKPAIALAPLSRFALNLHISAGWAKKRAAFTGDGEAAGQAIDILRATLDCIEAARHPDLYRAGAMWLAESYSQRAAPGDLAHAIEAYRAVARLGDPAAAPGRAAWLHMRMGVLHNHIGQQLKSELEGTDDPRVAARAEAAVAELARAEALYAAAGDLAGRAESAVAKADAVRLLGGTARYHEAANLYGAAWSVLQDPGAQDALGAERFQALLNQIYVCLQDLDRRQFGDPATAPVIGQCRGVATFLRPLDATRQVLLPPPGGGPPLSLEVALSRALNPAVAISYIGGMGHPQAGRVVMSVSERGWDEWRVPVQIFLAQSDLVIVVPGFTAGMQWELEYLRDEGLLGKCLMVMIPENPSYPARALWQKARAEAQGRGLALPPYAESGAFLRLDRDGRVLRQSPFEIVWTEGALLRMIEDLLVAPEDIQRREEGGARRLAALEHDGKLARAKLRYPGDPAES